MITLQYIPNRPEVKVTLVEGHTQVTKNIPFDSLNDFFLAQKASTKDTGFLGLNLVREIVTQEHIKRIYHYPEISVQLTASVLHSEDRRAIREAYIQNPHFRIQSVGDDPSLVFPIFKFKNIIGFIKNNNNAVKNVTGYSVCFAKPDLIGALHDNTRFVSSLVGNHYSGSAFGSKICWPNELKDTVKEVLNNQNPNIQSGFVRLYLSSRFNFDLQQARFSNYQTLLERNPGFKEFLFTCFSPSLFSSDREFWGTTFLVYLYLYYQFNILPNPEQDYLDNLSNLGSYETISRILS
jgi:hypothetical protein